MDECKPLPCTCSVRTFKAPGPRWSSAAHMSESMGSKPPTSTAKRTVLASSGTNSGTRASAAVAQGLAQYSFH
jgi:hypothetical protein